MLIVVGMSGDLSPMRWAARQASTAEELDTEESQAKDSELDADGKFFNQAEGCGLQLENW